MSFAYLLYLYKGLVPLDFYLKEVYLSLGSNLGERELFLKKAIRELQSSFEVFAISSFYETAPLDYEDQNHFLNSCLGLYSEYTAQDLLEFFKNLEKKLGRVKGIEKGPRCIDIDILFYGDEVIQSEKLTIPHKSLFNRAFVLVPLLEILPLKHKDYAQCKLSLEIINSSQEVKLFSIASHLDHLLSNQKKAL